jgi:hypothetical protein
VPQNEEANMTTPAVEVQGTLRPDGTIALDEMPNLPPGRVQVRVQPLPDLTQTDVWQVLEKIWAGQQARGHVPRSREEIDADIAAMRQEDEERMQAIERLHEECQRHRQPRPPADES